MWGDIFTAHSSSSLPRLSFWVFPFLTRFVPGPPARPFSLGSPCCPWVPGSPRVDGYRRPDRWPLSRLSGPPVFCHQNCGLCQSSHAVPSPHVYTRSSVLLSFRHTGGPWPSLPVGSLLQGRSPGGAVTSPGVKGLGSHSKAKVVWLVLTFTFLFHRVSHHCSFQHWTSGHFCGFLSNSFVLECPFCLFLRIRALNTEGLAWVLVLLGKRLPLFSEFTPHSSSTHRAWLHSVICSSWLFILYMEVFPGL